MIERSTDEAAFGSPEDRRRLGKIARPTLTGNVEAEAEPLSGHMSRYPTHVAARRVGDQADERLFGREFWLMRGVHASAAWSDMLCRGLAVQLGYLVIAGIAKADHTNARRRAARSRTLSGQQLPRPLCGPDASYLFHPISAWLDPADGEKMIAATRAFAAAMQPFSTGASYLNFTHEADRVRDAYGDAKYARLVALKDTYDPANLFRLKHNIQPSQPAAEPVLA